MKRSKTITVEDERLTPVEAATYLGLSAETLKRWRNEKREGSPRYIEIGYRKVVYPRSGLDEFLASRTVQP